MEICINEEQRGNPNEAQILNVLCPDVSEYEVEIIGKENYPYLFDVYIDGNLAETITSSDNGTIEISEVVYEKINDLQKKASV